MRRLSLFALAFFFIAAPIYVKYDVRGLTINGKVNPLGQAVLINGNTWAVPVDQFIRAFGGTLTMEQAGFQMKGNSLWTLTSNDLTSKHIEKSATQKSYVASEPTVKLDQPALKVRESAMKPDDIAIKKVSLGGGVYVVRKAGKVGDIIPFNGKNYLSVNDIARAFGTTFTAPAGNLTSGQTLTLNFAVNGDGILGARP